MTDWYCDEALSGRTPVVVVAETPHVLAFEHTRPHWGGAHVVVIPKRHILSFIDFSDADREVVEEVLLVTREIAAKVAQAHGGAHVVTNVGKYQESKHFHIHVGAD